MRADLEKKYSNGNISQEEIEKYKLSILVKRAIIFVVYVFILVLSILRLRRARIFFGVLGAGKLISIHGVALVFYILSASLVFIYLFGSIIYIVVELFRKKDWLPCIHKMNVNLDFYVFFAKTLSILLFLMIFVTTPCTVVGQSMEPTFADGDRLICSEFFRNPSKGDIIVFDAQNYTNSQSFYIKRVVATEGDTLSFDVETNKTYINGEYYEDISSSDFAVLRKSASSTSNTITVPKNAYVVLGDNRGNSWDSRKFGFVYDEDVFGIIYIRLFPHTRFF